MEKCGKLGARVIDRCARLTAGRMHARWISKMSIEVRQHRFTRFIAKRGSRVVIEINHVLLLVLIILAESGERFARRSSYSNHSCRSCARLSKEAFLYVHLELRLLLFALGKSCAFPS